MSFPGLFPRRKSLGHVRLRLATSPEYEPALDRSLEPGAKANLRWVIVRTARGAMKREGSNTRNESHREANAFWAAESDNCVASGRAIKSFKSNTSIVTQRASRRSHALMSSCWMICWLE
jgi:hypothetical protein